jgi:hypothetical protein
MSVHNGLFAGQELIESGRASRPLTAQPLAKSYKKSSHEKGKEKKGTLFFIKKYDQPLCLKCLSLRAFLRLFVAIFPSSWCCPRRCKRMS